MDRPLLLDTDHLKHLRARVHNQDPEVQHLATGLMHDADAALSMTAPSVMDKDITPPSGDKHDYMSQAPYYWPNPSTPDGLPYVSLDGERNPEVEQFDRMNLHRVEDAVLALTLAFHLTGNDDYGAQAGRLLRVWFLDPATRMNPHLQYGQGVPGESEGRRYGIIETHTLPTLLDAVTLLAASPHWTDTDHHGLQAWMRDYLTWLLDSPFGQAETAGANNHGTWCDVQVAGLAMFTGQPHLAKLTLQRSPERIARQIEPDGRQPRELKRTRPWNYSLFNLKGFFQLATLADHVGLDLWRHRTIDGATVRQGLDYLIPYATRDQPWPHNEPVAPIEPAALAWRLRRAATAWNNNPTYASLATELAGQHHWTDIYAQPATVCLPTMTTAQLDGSSFGAWPR